ncbi:peptidoglycan-binding domain-containing protein [Methyloceanibacter sp.]|uniref:peptidoglycan-binding domain-containing protein n=1 Tax=Methyloceanibacter sp. TaxID=1965321 RepID=UPI003D6C8855
MATRLLFLAFIGLTGFITYNALYLQEQRNGALLPTAGSQRVPLPDGPIHVANPPASAPKPVSVTTDLPPLRGQPAPQQLVTAIQRELAARGYASGTVNGKLSDETRKAIATFEKDRGLPITGSPSDELLRRILLGEAAPPAASTGSVAAANGAPRAKPNATAGSDSTIKQVQQILADLGYAPGPVDGTMGDETQRAVSAFQRDRKIAQNGRITPELLREIKRVTGRDLSATASRP